MRCLVGKFSFILFLFVFVVGTWRWAGIRKRPQVEINPQSILQPQSSFQILSEENGDEIGEDYSQISTYDSPKITLQLFIGIMSAFNNTSRRNAIRQSWLKGLSNFPKHQIDAKFMLADFRLVQNKTLRKLLYREKKTIW